MPRGQGDDRAAAGGVQGADDEVAAEGLDDHAAGSGHVRVQRHPAGVDEPVPLGGGAFLEQRAGTR
jgi:hypothetical protein